MITHRIKLPDGTEIEFFASDEALFQEKFGNFEHINEMQNADEFRRFKCLFKMAESESRATKHKAPKAIKQARKRQKQARRKQR